MNKRAFTIMELVVTIALIAILAIVAIPVYSNVQDKAKYEADNASVVILNRSTIAYALANDINSPDIFESIDTDPLRMQKLVDEEYLASIVSPQQDDTEFKWIVPSQIWTIDGGKTYNLDQPQDPDPTQSPDNNDDDDIDLSNYPSWDSNSIYSSANTYVVYDGKLYYNLWWVDGNILPGTDQVWQQVSTKWVYYNRYYPGDTTIYNGQTYKARFWTAEVAPYDSEYGPWELLLP